MKVALEAIQKTCLFYTKVYLKLEFLFLIIIFNQNNSLKKFLKITLTRYQVVILRF